MAFKPGIPNSFIALVVTTLTAVGLIVSGSLTLSKQAAGRVLYTETGGVATTTPNLAYASTTQTLTVANVSSTAVTVNNKNVCLADGTNCQSSGSQFTTSTQIVFGSGSNTPTSNANIITDGNGNITQAGSLTSNGSTTSSLSGSLILQPSGSATGSIQIFNTAATNTNTNSLILGFSGTAANIENYEQGSGGSGSVTISAVTGASQIPGNHRLNISSTSPVFKFSVAGTENSPTIEEIGTASGGIGASSGNQTALQVDTPIAQSGSAGYVLVSASTTETSTGSGSKVLFQGSVGQLTKFSVDDTGAVSSTGAITNSATATSTVTGPISASSTSVNLGVAGHPSLNFGAGNTAGFGDGLLDNPQGTVTLDAGGTSVVTFNSFGLTLNNNIVASGDNARSIGSISKAMSNVYTYGLNASGTTINFPNLTANLATDNFVCQSSTGTLFFESANCTVSSARFKDHIQAMKPSDLLSEVMELKPSSFQYKTGRGAGLLGTPDDQGFIAEEVAQIDPYLVAWEKNPSAADLAFEQANYPGAIRHDADGVAMIPRSVAYDHVGVLEAGAIQAQQAEIVALQNRVSVIDKIIKWIESLLIHK